MDHLTLTSRTSDDTRHIGRALGRHTQPGDLILLIGGLGAGKTTLTQGIAQGLDTAEPARSPTFVLVAQYQGRLTLYHADLYRVDNPLEALELGFEEFLENGVCVIEWAEKAPEAFPQDRMEIHIATNKDEMHLERSGWARHITLTAHGPRYQALLAAVASALKMQEL
ncbi:MAG: tRNA (adenosine(37)-N6)-threonylcarbamoyltransferase complex ATPase subunit type 1 TsaE [Dehalococcoidia bacterium]|nr:tRNA (adenosine(37)-N6)-threonylcarbamoyltransferase complex ATPase subunit type 1 TsaE [Dehalococcoidia bacterium]